MDSAGATSKPSPVTRNLVVPDAALALIRQQRTHLAGDDAALAAAYAADVAADVSMIWPWLPAPCHRWIDIGCGVGGLSALLYVRIVRPRAQQFYLVDGTADGAVRAGFHERALEPWNDRGVTSALLTANNVPATRGLWLQVGVASWVEPTVDLIVSTLSWGHHYPVDTYAELVRQAVRPGGRVILDMRKRTGGEAALDGLGLVQIAELPLTGLNARKSTRQVWQRPAGDD